MKKFISILLSLTMIFSVVGCSSNKNTESKDQEEESSESIDEEEQLEADKEELSAIGDVEVENGILFVKITLPADLAEGVTQESLDEGAGENYTSATLNEDGSVTYKMTKGQHQAMLDDMTESYEESFQEMIDDEEYAFTEIKHNQDFTVYDVTLSTDEVGITEAFSVWAFYLYSGMYMIFSGVEDNVVVNFYGPSGNLIESYNSADSE